MSRVSIRDDASPRIVATLAGYVLKLLDSGIADAIIASRLGVVDVGLGVSHNQLQQTVLSCFAALLRKIAEPRET